MISSLSLPPHSLPVPPLLSLSPFHRLRYFPDPSCLSYGNSFHLNSLLLFSTSHRTRGVSLSHISAYVANPHSTPCPNCSLMDLCTVCDLRSCSFVSVSTHSPSYTHRSCFIHSQLRLLPNPPPTRESTCPQCTLLYSHIQQVSGPDCRNSSIRNYSFPLLVLVLLLVREFRPL